MERRYGMTGIYAALAMAHLMQPSRSAADYDSESWVRHGNDELAHPAEQPGYECAPFALLGVIAYLTIGTYGRARTCEIALWEVAKSYRALEQSTK